MMTLRLFSAALLLIPVLGAADTYRLSNVATPVSYELNLAIDPAKDGFEGSISIAVQLARATNTIDLHAVDLEITGARINGKAATHAPAGIEMIALRAPQELQPGRIRIELDFRGKYDSKGSRGIFKQMNGSDAFVFTHFEPTDARRAFPCFDEPGFKAPWTIRLKTPKDLVAVSNAPEMKSEEGEGQKTVSFRQTKPLPTYLIAFAVGHFDVVDVGKVGRNGTPVRTIVPRGDGADTALADAFTKRVLPEIEKYFGTAYPFEKLDQIAIPHTVSFGAMENPGLITYMRGLLVSRDDSMFSRQYRYTTITHELAHQWFGNLVTHKWWDDIWLNEALATWMERKIVAITNPELNMESEAVRMRSYAIRSDILDSARKIRQPVEDRNDVAAVFDSITYEKGGAVLGMFENFLGEAAFRRGLQQYLQRHQWKSVTAADFVEAMGSAGGKNLGGTFSSFLDQPGVPLFRTELRCAPGSAVVSVSQERLLPVGSAAPKGSNWEAPLCLRFGSDARATTQCEVVKQGRQEVVLKTDTCPTWVVADANAAGYYAVGYSSKMAADLVANADQMTARERAGAILNTLALTRTSQIPIADALAIASRFATDPDVAISLPSLTLAQELKKYVPAGSLPAFQRFLFTTFGGKVRELGFEPKSGETSNTSQLRMMLLLNLAGASPEIDAQVTAVVDRWMDDPKSISSNMLMPTLASYAARGGMKEFEKLRKALERTADMNQKLMIIGSMSFLQGEAEDAALAVLLDPKVDVREYRMVLRNDTGRLQSAERVWKFVRTNYDTLSRRFPAEAQEELIAVTQRLCSTADADSVREFFGPKVGNIEGGPRTLAQAEETIRLCAARRAKQGPEIEGFLKTVN